MLNAIIHRDYSGFASIMIRVYDKKLSIWNEGSLIHPLNIEMLKEEHPSLLRNRLIANIFYFAGYIEAWGRGTLSIINQLSQEGLPEPSFSTKGGGFEIAFHYEPANEPVNEPENVPENVTKDVTKDVTKESRQLMILELLKNSGTITIDEIAEKLNVTRRTVLRMIEELKAHNKIKRIGGRKTGYWQIL